MCSTPAAERRWPRKDGTSHPMDTTGGPPHDRRWEGINGDLWAKRRREARPMFSPRAATEKNTATVGQCWAVGSGLSTSVKNPHTGGFFGGVGAQQSIARTCSGCESPHGRLPLGVASREIRCQGTHTACHARKSPCRFRRLGLMAGRAKQRGTLGRSRRRLLLPVRLLACLPVCLFVINALRRHDDVRDKTSHLETFKIVSHSHPSGLMSMSDWGPREWKATGWLQRQAASGLGRPIFGNIFAPHRALEPPHHLTTSVCILSLTKTGFQFRAGLATRSEREMTRRNPRAVLLCTQHRAECCVVVYRTHSIAVVAGSPILMARSVLYLPLPFLYPKPADRPGGACCFGSQDSPGFPIGACIASLSRIVCR